MSTHKSDLPNEPDWKRVFDEAAEAPPPRVWDAIERQLDADRRPGGIVLPLWVGSVRPGWWASGVAAALLIAIGLGWQWFQPSTPLVTADRRESLVSKTGPIDTNSTQVDHNASDLSTISVDNVMINTKFVDKPLKNTGRRQYTQQNDRGNKLPPTVYPMVGQQTTFPAVGQSVAINMPIDGLERSAWRVGSINFLANRSAHFPHLAMTRDIETVSVSVPTPDAASPVTRKRSRPEAWVSANVLSGDFTSNMGLTSLPPASAAVANSYAAFQATTTTTPAQQPFGNRKRGASSVQISAGVQLTKHWLAEAGVAYTQAHSEVLSPLRTLPPTYDLILPAGLSVGTTTQYVDLIQARLTSNQAAGKFTASAPLDVPTPRTYYDNSQRRAVSNDYTFVQLPVQAGYEFRPRRKLGVAVLGGMIANIFVRNRVDNHLDVKPADGIYERLAWSSSASLRVRYRTGKRWSATLAGVYERALQPATRVGGEVVSHPEFMGLTMGLNCHF